MTTPTLHIDFETRSVLDLKEVGLWNYARHPSTDVWCMAWAFGEDEPEVWVPGSHGPLPDVTGKVQVIAHNAPFELEIWNEIMARRYGWPTLHPEQTYCTSVTHRTRI